MADVVSAAKRSVMMSGIRSHGNRATELRLIDTFRKHGVIGWRRNAKMFGKPDFVFPGPRVAVFVDGCFWHRHRDCRFSYTPKTRLEFWLPKFERNVQRDKLVTQTLRKAGWRVVRIWECDLRKQSSGRVINRIRHALEGGDRR